MEKLVTVTIYKPSNDKKYPVSWVDAMDKYDGATVKISEYDLKPDSFRHGGWVFLLEWCYIHGSLKQKPFKQTYNLKRVR